MTNETKHTPTPWKVESDTTLIWGDCNPDDNSTRGMGYPIAECRINPSGNWSTGPYADEGAANAAHIVKCVNMHDELVEALLKTEKRFDINKGIDEEEYIYRQDVRAALAKARVEA